MIPASGKRRVGRGEHGAARVPMRGDERIEALDAVVIEAVKRLIEEPKRCARSGNPRERRPLRLTRRKQSHRHVGKARQIQGVQSLIESGRITGPEGQRPAQEQFTVERQRLVRQRQLSPLYPARFCS